MPTVPNSWRRFARSPVIKFPSHMPKVHISSGAIVYTREQGKFSVLVMHRQKTDSWHLPKGTQEPGEDLPATARREVREETGLEIALGPYLGKLHSVIHRDGQVIPKETHYFLAQPIGGNLIDHDREHDTVAFVAYDQAHRHLERFSLHEREGEILKMAFDKLPVEE